MILDDDDDDGDDWLYLCLNLYCFQGFWLEISKIIIILVFEIIILTGRSGREIKVMQRRNWKRNTIHSFWICYLLMINSNPKINQIFTWLKSKWTIMAGRSFKSWRVNVREVIPKAYEPINYKIIYPIRIIIIILLLNIIISQFSFHLTLFHHIITYRFKKLRILDHLVWHKRNMWMNKSDGEKGE